MKSDTYQRVNITLPSPTLRRMDAVAKQGDRSRFIDAAVNAYISEHNRGRLHAALKEGAALRAVRDRDIAAELFANEYPPGIT